MKFSVPAADLLSALSYVKTIVHQSDVAILSHIALQATPNKLTIRSHCLFAEKVIDLDIAVEEPAAICLPVDQFYTVLAGAPANQTVTVSVKERATVTWGRSRYTLPTLPVDGFPATFKLPSSVAFQQPLTDDLRETILRRPSTLCLDGPGAPPLYSGPWLHPVDGRLASIGSDGTRMYCYVSKEPWLMTAPAMISRQMALEATKMAADAISWDAATLLATRGQKRMGGKLIDAAYADYRALIPSTANPYLEFGREEFLGALERLGRMATHGSIVRLKWTDNPRSAILDFPNGEGTEAVRCRGTIPAGVLGLPPIRGHALIELLTGPVLRMHVEQQMRPLRLVDPDEPNAIVMLAPARVSV